MPKWTVGQDVIIRHNFGRAPQDHKAKVVKVARVFVTAIGPSGRQEKFRIDTGRYNSTDYPNHMRLLTLDDARHEELAAKHGALVQRLYDSRRSKFSAEQFTSRIEALEALLAQPESESEGEA